MSWFSLKIYSNNAFNIMFDAIPMLSRSIVLSSKALSSRDMTSWMKTSLAAWTGSSAVLPGSFARSRMTLKNTLTLPELKPSIKTWNNIFSSIGKISMNFCLIQSINSLTCFLSIYLSVILLISYI